MSSQKGGNQNQGEGRGERVEEERKREKMAAVLAPKEKAMSCKEAKTSQTPQLHSLDQRFKTAHFGDRTEKGTLSFKAHRKLFITDCWKSAAKRQM